jgi:hypothetical protein
MSLEEFLATEYFEKKRSSLNSNQKKQWPLSHLWVALAISSLRRAGTVPSQAAKVKHIQTSGMPLPSSSVLTVVDRPAIILATHNPTNIAGKNASVPG